MKRYVANHALLVVMYGNVLCLNACTLQSPVTSTPTAIMSTQVDSESILITRQGQTYNVKLLHPECLGTSKNQKEINASFNAPPEGPRGWVTILGDVLGIIPTLLTTLL